MSINFEAGNQMMRDTSAFAATNEEKIRRECEEMVDRVELQGVHESHIPIDPDQPPIVLGFARLGSVVGAIFPAANDFDATLKSGIPAKESGRDLFQIKFSQGVLQEHSHLTNLI